MTLNTPAGLVDLLTGELREHDPQDYCSRPESRIKQMTGGDKIAARFMRGDFFEFSPQFKLVIAGNHKPGLRSVDEAIRRRFNLIPFTVHIPAAERDEQLAERLKQEWPGILAWMIEGCLAWQADRLNPPPVVTQATAEYLESEDAMTCWLEEKCERGPEFRTNSTDLFVSWKNWADTAGEPVGTQKRFSQKLEERGFEKVRTRYGREFVGLRIVSSYGVTDVTEGYISTVTRAHAR
jgi:putative DNA primase/helicase